MNRNSVLTAAFFLLVTASGARSQQPTPNTAQGEKPPSQAAAYQVAVQLYELEDGKRINSRSYNFIARPDESTNFRNGLRVPVPGSKEEVSNGGKDSSPTFRSEGPHYEDAGLQMQARIEEQEFRGERSRSLPAGTVGFDFNVELTALASQDQVNAGGPPVLRVTSQRINSIVPLDKPTVIASLDEVNSTHRMQVEVTVTKIRF